MNFSTSITVTEKGKRSPNWNLESDISGEKTFEDLARFTKNSLILIHGEVLREEIGRGFPKNHLTIVDKKYGKIIEDVSPFGSIRSIRKVNLSKVLIYTYENLIRLSPVLTGAYKSSHYVFHNERLVATDLNSLKNWIDIEPTINERDRIRIVDVQHYAGKLERNGITSNGSKRIYGKGKRRKGVTPMVKKPNGAYFLSANLSKQKYGKNTLISFEWRPGSMFKIPKYKNAKHEYVYPTILIYIFSSGVE